jgi:hypothetical protein
MKDAAFELSWVGRYANNLCATGRFVQFEQILPSYFFGIPPVHHGVTATVALHPNEVRRTGKHGSPIKLPEPVSNECDARLKKHGIQIDPETLYLVKHAEKRGHWIPGVSLNIGGELRCMLSRHDFDIG